MAPLTGIAAPARRPKGPEEGAGRRNDRECRALQGRMESNTRGTHMSRLSLLVVAAGLLCGAAPALAATAHNSQAGSWGPNKHNCEPTPYFQQGGCVESFLTGRDDGWVGPRTERYQDPYRERPPLRPFDR